MLNNLNFKIMKVKLNQEMERDGVVYKEGDIIDIPEANVSVWEEKGWGVGVKKEEKGKKETKELKTSKDKK